MSPKIDIQDSESTTLQERLTALETQVYTLQEDYDTLKSELLEARNLIEALASAISSDEEDEG